MSDERVVERYFERAVDLVTELTRQVARLAYAAEQQVIVTVAHGMDLMAPCVTCGCRLMTEHHDECPACRAPARTHA